MQKLSRREWLKLAAAGLLVTSLPRRLYAAPPSLDIYPFTLGVASGYPSPNSVVLWTRLAPQPLAPQGGLAPAVYPVRYEMATDEQFRSIVRTGTAHATPDWGYSVHVEAGKLDVDRPYWYRFWFGDALSPVGRTHTAPATGSPVERLRFAIASCQNYEHGYFSAYRHMRADELHLILHLGDYIYEGSWGPDPLRRHEDVEATTLDQYRARYALYKQDPDLQAAHAACPWLLTWDDHEVENDYAGERSENADEPAWFLARRAAAYQAYFEHMPLRRSQTPNGPWLRLHSQQDWGALASLHMLDDRQYRSPQPCPKPGRWGSNMVDGGCPELYAEGQTLLGERQEAWLEAGLKHSKAQWHLLGQQTLMAQADAWVGPGELLYSDGWSGYPLARKRLLDFLADRQIANPVVLGGDMHSFWASDLKRDFARPESAIVAAEFVTTSVSAYGPPPERLKAAKDEGPHIHYASSERRGYLRFELTPERLRADLRGLVDARDVATDCETVASFVVENGRPGVQPA